MHHDELFYTRSGLKRPKNFTQFLGEITQKLGKLTYKVTNRNKMEMYECLHCKKTFTKKGVLTRHVKSSQQCIKRRVSIIKVSSTFVCPCGYSTTRKDHFSTHEESCERPKIGLDLETYRTLVIDRDKTIENCGKTIECHLKTIKDRDGMIAKLEAQVDKLMSRPIINNTVNNNGNIYNIKFYKQHALENFEAITQPLLQGVMEQLTLADISYGGAGFAKFAKKHFDHQHLLILDNTRRRGMYKDANGQVVVDSKLRALLERLGQAGFPPANKLFTNWSVENRDDCFLDSTKSKLLGNLVDVTGWLKRVGEGKIVEDDSATQASFLDELVSGYTKEALHNYLEQQVTPPLLDIEEVSTDVPKYSCECKVSDYESDIEMDVASIASSEFDIQLGIISYEKDYDRGVKDRGAYWIEYKGRSKYANV
jgi:hypothetical protein